MTEPTIQSKIDSVNTDPEGALIFIKAAAGNVKFAHAWNKFPDGLGIAVQPFFLYFIYSEANRCIGAVLDHGEHDLHCYVQEDHRHKGFMKKALRDYILPHLRAEGRQEQCVTFSTAESRGLLEGLGFTIHPAQKASLDLSRLNASALLLCAPKPLSPQRLQAIKVTLRQAAELLRRTKDEVDVALLDEWYIRIQNDIDCIRDRAEDLEDVWWRNKKSL